MRDLECEIWLTLSGRVLGIHQLDFLFNFGGHKARLKGSRAKGESPMDSRTSSTTEILHRYGTREERFSRFFLHHCIGLKSSPLSLPMILVSVDAHSAPGGVCIAQLVLRKWRNEVLLEKG